MKKLLALLLAFALVGAAVFAEDAPKLGFSGVVTGTALGLYNNATDTVMDSNVLVDLDASFDAGTYGFEAELEWAKPDAGMSTNTTETLAPYFNYGYGWFKLLDGKVKVSAGNMFITDYRTRNVALATYGGGAIAGDGLAVELFAVEGLSLAAYVPAPSATINFVSGAYAGTTKVADALKDIDIFAKYGMDIGTFYASYQMGAVTSKFNVAANLKLVEGFTTNFGFDATLGGSTTPMNIYGIVGTTLAGIAVRDDLTLTIDGSTFKWWNQVRADYKMDMIRFRLDARLWNAGAATDYVNIRVTPSVTYMVDSVTSLGVAFRYDMNTQSGSKPTWRIPVSYTVAF